MRVFIVMPAQTRQRSLLIIDITRDVQVTVHLDRSVILELDETSGLVHQPKFADRRGGRRVCVRERTSDDDAVFRITLLGENQNLIARRRGQYMPHPAPIQGERTGNQPLSTPSGCRVTRTVAAVGFTEVTVAKRGWLLP